MPITIEIPHAISRYSNEENAVDVEAETVGVALEHLWERYPDLKSRVLTRDGHFHAYLLLFHNDQKLPRSAFETTPVQNGDRLEIVALAEGG